MVEALRKWCVRITVGSDVESRSSHKRGGRYPLKPGNLLQPKPFVIRPCTSCNHMVDVPSRKKILAEKMRKSCASTALVSDIEHRNVEAKQPAFDAMENTTPQFVMAKQVRLNK